MISIVIPTYNEGKQPEALMQSLPALRGIGEILIVDSSDDELSREVLEGVAASGRAKVVRSVAKGRAAQMNLGARQCNGDVVIFLHCDTTLPVSAPEEVHKVLSRYRWGRFDLRLDAPGLKFRIIERMINLRSRVTRIATGDQAIFTNRKFFLDQGGFTDIPLMEDIDFSRRVGAEYPPALIEDPVSTSARRWIVHGTVRTILLMWKLRLLYRLGVSPDRLAGMYRAAR